MEAESSAASAVGAEAVRDSGEISARAASKSAALGISKPSRPVFPVSASWVAGACEARAGAAEVEGAALVWVVVAIIVERSATRPTAGHYPVKRGGSACAGSEHTLAHNRADLAENMRHRAEPER